MSSSYDLASPTTDHAADAWVLVMTIPEGRPVAVRALEGNIADPAACAKARQDPLEERRDALELLKPAVAERPERLEARWDGSVVR